MSKRSRARNKQLRNRRKKQKLVVQSPASSATSGRLNRRTVSRLPEATNLINAGHFSAAEEILTEEDRRHNGHPSILEDLLWLHQAQEDHLSATLIAERLLRVRPQDAEVRLSPDRGDEAGRMFAFTLAKAVKSPDLMDALHHFAFSTRGPDQLRSEALNVLQENDRLGPGPHRVFYGGEWKEIELFSPEITDVPQPVKTPKLEKLHEEGYFALSDDDPEKAELIFRRCIELDPDDPTSRHNLAGALIQYGDYESEVEAKRILNDLLERFPDYSFARTSLAQLAIRVGDLQAACDLMAPLKQRQQMHRSEIMAYFSVVGEISFAGNALESVEQTVSMMEQIDPNHPNTSIFRRRLDFARRASNSPLQRQSLAIPGHFQGRSDNGSGQRY